MASHEYKFHNINRTNLHCAFSLFAVVVFMILIGCTPSAREAWGEVARLLQIQGYIDTLAQRWAPIHYQDVDPDGTWSLGGRSDFITAVDFDNDWNTTNNWENISTRYNYIASGQAYYSVVLTQTHAFIIYAFYHPRDWEQNGNKWDAHENDMEGLLEVVELPGRVGSNGFDYTNYGILKAFVTVCHGNFYSYVNLHIPDEEKFTAGDEDIDGQISFMDWNGNPHPVTAQDSGSHCLKAWPYKDIEGGDGLVYHPFLNVSIQPSGPDNRNSRYGLIDIFKEDGLWDHRDAPETFSSFGVFNCDNHCWNYANPPWGWDDKDDSPGKGDFAIDPVNLGKSYFKNLGDFSLIYIYNRYQDIGFIFP
jgi:hypothetical protein